MMTLFYIAILCYDLNFFETSDRLQGCFRTWDKVGLAALVSDNRFVYKYGFIDTTWGASLKDQQRVPPKDLLERLSWVVDFDGDGKLCR